MNFREEDVPVDIGVLPAANKKQGQEQSLLVLTTRGYGKRVDMDEFKTTRRWGFAAELGGEAALKSLSNLFLSVTLVNRKTVEIVLVHHVFNHAGGFGCALLHHSSHENSILQAIVACSATKTRNKVDFYWRIGEYRMG